MKQRSQHLINMLRFLYNLKMIGRDEVFAVLNKEPLKTWQRIDQIEKIMDYDVVYNGIRDDDEECP